MVLCKNLWLLYCLFFFFQAEDGIRYLVRSRGLGDVYKRQTYHWPTVLNATYARALTHFFPTAPASQLFEVFRFCLLYTSDAADERSSVDLGGRRIIKKKNIVSFSRRPSLT